MIRNITLHLPRCALFSFLTLCIYMMYLLRHPHGASRSRQNTSCRSTEANGTTAGAAIAASTASTTTRLGSSRSIYTGFGTERGWPLECKRPRRSWSTACAHSRRSTEDRRQIFCPAPHRLAIFFIDKEVKALVFRYDQKHYIALT